AEVLGQRDRLRLHAVEPRELLAQLVALMANALQLVAHVGERAHRFFTPDAERFQPLLLIFDQRFGDLQRPLEPRESGIVASGSFRIAGFRHGVARARRSNRDVSMKLRMAELSSWHAYSNMR